MKEYNRTTKRWEEKSTEQVPDLKKPEFCRGKQPHDYILTVPEYSNSHKNDDVSQENIEKFYELLDSLNEAKKAVQVAIDSLGISYKVFYFHDSQGEKRHLKCSVCGKVKW